MAIPHSRRQFLLSTGSALAAASIGCTGSKTSENLQARYWEKESNLIRCTLCPHQCIIPEGQKGRCRSRMNLHGSLVNPGYEKPCVIKYDPIEKKTIYHVNPEVKVCSIAIAGCSFRCQNCQNFAISQVSPDDTLHLNLSANDVVQRAKENGCSTIAFSYSEPTTWFEYMTDVATASKKAGMTNLLITNGFINSQPLSELKELIDIINVDLKGFDEQIYPVLNGGSLKYILQTLKAVKKSSMWLEITNLVIPTWTDNPAKIAQMCTWIKNEIGTETPLHFSRFYPRHKLSHLQETSESTLLQARNIAYETGLRYIYINGVDTIDNSTICPDCGQLIIKRTGYSVKNVFSRGKCNNCQKIIPGFWNA